MYLWFSPIVCILDTWFSILLSTWWFWVFWNRYNKIMRIKQIRRCILDFNISHPSTHPCTHTHPNICKHTHTHIYTHPHTQRTHPFSFLYNISRINTWVFHLVDLCTLINRELNLTPCFSSHWVRLMLKQAWQYKLTTLRGLSSHFRCDVDK